MKWNALSVQYVALSVQWRYDFAIFFYSITIMVNLTKPEELSLDGPTPGNQGPQGWLQSDKQAHMAMWKLGVKSPASLTVLHFMVSKLARGTTGIIMSAPAMARQIGISERSVKAAVKLLQEMKFIQILKSGNTNAYVINSRVAWQGKRGFRYASFNAQILVDEEEQNNSVEQLEKEGNELIDIPVMEISVYKDSRHAQLDLEMTASEGSTALPKVGAE